MTIPSVPIARGLEGVVVAQTELSNVDGNAGTLEYRGYGIKDLALNALFEEVIYLLWFGKLPTRSELDVFHKDLAKEYTMPAELIGMMKQFPRSTHPMSAVRTAVSALGMFDPQAEDNSPESNLRKAYRLTGVIGTIVAAWGRIADGKEPVAPRENLYTAGNFLYMLTGQEASEAAVRAVNSYLVMLADHSMNASTFSARVTTSTQADMYSAIVTAIGTLKGAIHGGANEKAMLQFMEVASPDRVDAWFDALMETNNRIMGIGHRVYKTGDPRMFVSRDQARELAESTGEPRWYEIATRLEERALSHPYFSERKLFPNVDYYSAIVLYQSGIPVSLFTPLFAMSRMAGWCAHIIEQWQDNRLIRPDVLYAGLHDQPWTPLEKRG